MAHTAPLRGAAKTRARLLRRARALGLRQAVLARERGRRMVSLAGQIRVDIQSAATAVDIMANTDLDRAPGPGAVGVWAISDQTDSRMTVRIGSVQLASDIALPTGTLIDTDQPPIAMTAVGGGEKITIDVVEVTAMALHTIVIYIPG